MSMTQYTPMSEFGKCEDAKEASYFEKTGKGENDSNTNPNSSGEKPSLHIEVDADTTQSAPKEVEPNGDNNKECVRKSDRDNVQSPSTNKTRISTRGRTSSPSWERKGSYDANVHNVVSLTIRRPRSRSMVSSNENDEYASVPKFGDWDEENPATADRYSQIFEMVREEKLSGGAKVPTLWTETPNSSTQKRDNATIYQSWCCFPWSRK